MKRHFIHLAVVITLLAICASGDLRGQSAPANSLLGKSAKGQISGRILSEDGEPLNPANVSIFVNASNRPVQVEVSLDREGNFTIQNPAGEVYQLGVHANSYIAKGAFVDGGVFKGLAGPGDVINFTLSKGGVITGKVLDVNGDPLVGVKVMATRVADITGTKIDPAGSSQAGETDDRGIYRIFGLNEGEYRVFTKGEVSNTGTAAAPVDVPTYYPSDSLESAQAVAVSSGAEVNGIDIRHRGDPGHRISGTILAVTGSEEYSRTLFSIRAVYASSNSELTTISLFASDSAPFIFEGVPDGEYLITVSQMGFTGRTSNRVGASEPLKISVKGSDRTGIQIRMNPLTSVSGSLIVEKLSQETACNLGQPSSLPARFLSLVSVSKQVAGRPIVAGTSLEKIGPFTIDGVTSGVHRIQILITEGRYFLKSISVPLASPALKPDTQKYREISGLINVSAGSPVSGLKFIVAEGAGSINGKVTGTEQGDYTVVLVPRERERASMGLHFRSVTAIGREYSFQNVAPGKYWILARRNPKGSPPKDFQAAVQDSVERLSLIKEAERTGKEVEVGICQKVSNVVLPAFPR